jgi:hypothetical protein
VWLQGITCRQQQQQQQPKLKAIVTRGYTPIFDDRQCMQIFNMAGAHP